MDAFDKEAKARKWVFTSEIAKKDGREYFLAGMRAAAEHAYWLFINNDMAATAVEVRDAILAEADK